MIGHGISIDPKGDQLIPKGINDEPIRGKNNPNRNTVDRPGIKLLQNESTVIRKGINADSKRIIFDAKRTIIEPPCTGNEPECTRAGSPTGSKATPPAAFKDSSPALQCWVPVRTTRQKSRKGRKTRSAVPRGTPPAFFAGDP
ncbi:MAG: hypothetical protein ABI318_07870, partial [Chthoniobacteraceae bacterium]